MKKRIMFAVIASAMIAATAMTSVAYAEDTTLSASESTAKFTRGVWAAYEDKDGDGKYDDLCDYYIFDDDKNGHTSTPGTGIGIPFTVEQNGSAAVFHFASADDNTKAEIKDLEDGDLLITFTYDSGDTKTYRLTFLAGADPDTFSGENDQYADEKAESASASIKTGVWAAYEDKSGDGKYDDLSDYYIFDDEKSGHTSAPKSGLGIPFSYEQTGSEAVFHFASADDNTKAEIKNGEDGDLLITFTYDSGDTKTYRLTYLVDVDPKTFSGEDANFADEAFLTKGVWAAYLSSDGSDNYDLLDEFFVIDSETSGRTSTPVMGIGLQFTMEQSGENTVFHFANREDSSKAEIKYVSDNELLVTIYYDGANCKKYRFIKLEGYDTETFSGDSVYYGTFNKTEEGFQLYNANIEIRTLAGIPRADEVGIKINYAMPLTNGFEIDFAFATTDKQFKTYTVTYDSQIDNDTIFIKLGDILRGIGSDGKDIASFTVMNKRGGDIVNLGFVADKKDAATINVDPVPASDVAGATENNPGTGTAGLFAVGTLAAAAGLTAFFSRKRK